MDPLEVQKSRAIQVLSESNQAIAFLFRHGDLFGQLASKDLVFCLQVANMAGQFLLTCPAKAINRDR
jgi:hypothetical protein